MIDNYDIYIYSRNEWFKYFLQGAFIGAVIGFLFYSNLIGTLALSLYGFFYVHNKKKQLITDRKWQLNLEFRDGLAGISSALNAGYSAENAFEQAIADLKLMYSPDALIVREFEGIV